MIEDEFLFLLAVGFTNKYLKYYMLEEQIIGRPPFHTVCKAFLHTEHQAPGTFTSLDRIEVYFGFVSFDLAADIY